MRLFIAISLSDELKEKVFQIEEKLKESKAKVKWVEKENLHLTLKFLGDISKELVEKLEKVLSDLVSSFSSFEIEFSNLGAFPSIQSKNMRVIWVGVEKGKEKLIELSKTLNEKLKSDFKKEEFTPHLTLGRVKSFQNLEALQEIMKKFSEIQFGNMKVKELILMQSELKSSGPIYTPIKKFEFERR